MEKAQPWHPPKALGAAIRRYREVPTPTHAQQVLDLLHNLRRAVLRWCRTGRASPALRDASAIVGAPQAALRCLGNGDLAAEFDLAVLENLSKGNLIWAINIHFVNLVRRYRRPDRQWEELPAEWDVEGGSPESDAGAWRVSDRYVLATLDDYLEAEWPPELPPDRRQLLVWDHLEGYTHREIRQLYLNRYGRLYSRRRLSELIVEAGSSLSCWRQEALMPIIGDTVLPVEWEHVKENFGTRYPSLDPITPMLYNRLLDLVKRDHPNEVAHIGRRRRNNKQRTESAAFLVRFVDVKGWVHYVYVVAALPLIGGQPASSWDRLSTVLPLKALTSKPGLLDLVPVGWRQSVLNQSRTGEATREDSDDKLAASIARDALAHPVPQPAPVPQTASTPQATESVPAGWLKPTIELPKLYDKVTCSSGTLRWYVRTYCPAEEQSMKPYSGNQGRPCRRISPKFAHQLLSRYGDPKKLAEAQAVLDQLARPPKNVAAPALPSCHTRRELPEPLAVPHEAWRHVLGTPRPGDLPQPDPDPHYVHLLQGARTRLRASLERHALDADDVTRMLVNRPIQAMSLAQCQQVSLLLQPMFDKAMERLSPLLDEARRLQGEKRMLMDEVRLFKRERDQVVETLEQHKNQASQASLESARLMSEAHQRIRQLEAELARYLSQRRRRLFGLLPPMKEGTS